MNGQLEGFFIKGFLCEVVYVSEDGMESIECPWLEILLRRIKRSSSVQMPDVVFI